jgi:hypothetical protein
VARAELTVGDVTAVDWLSVVVKELERRPYATTGFTGDAGQLLAGGAVTRSVLASSTAAALPGIAVG